VKGERVFLKCYSCHTLEPGQATLPGPSLVGILGARPATRPDFAYSEGMQRFAASNRRWTVALLDRYIADPAKLVPGTTMVFPGIRDAAERKELLDYLRRRGQKPSYPPTDPSTPLKPRTLILRLIGREYLPMVGGILTWAV